MTVHTTSHNADGAPTCCRKHIGEHDRTMPETPLLLRARFIVCSTCGNKRCPKATDCALTCTNSNDVGQKGSVYA